MSENIALKNGLNGRKPSFNAQLTSNGWHPFTLQISPRPRVVCFEMC